MGEILRIEDHRRRKPVTLPPSPPDAAELASFFQDFEKILEAYYILAQSIFEQADQQTVVLKNLQMVSDARYGHLAEV